MTKRLKTAVFHLSTPLALCAFFIAACVGTGSPVDDTEDNNGGGGASGGPGGSGGQGTGLNKDDPAVRFGSRSKDPCKGSPGPQITIIGMGGGEQSGCSANEPAKGQWHCFEALVRQPNKVSVQTYIDGRALTYQSSGKPVSMSIETTDAISQKVNHLRLGFFTHNSTGAGNVFIDDVVVARERVGCGG